MQNTHNDYYWSYDILLLVLKKMEIPESTHTLQTMYKTLATSARETRVSDD